MIINLSPVFYFTHTDVGGANSNSGGFFRFFGGYGVSWSKWMRPSMRLGARKYWQLKDYYITILKP